MYPRVIVGVDGSRRAQQAVAVGAAAAAGFGCPVELVQVGDDALPVPDEDVPTAADRLGEVNRVVADDPAAGLIAHAEASRPAGLLCLSSRGRTAIGEVVLGSVTAAVLRRHRAPLLVAGPQLRAPTAPWRRMLVCLDGSENAAGIVPIVTAWARALDLDVRLVHVAYPLGGPYVGDVEVPDEDLAAAEQLRTVAAALAGEGIAVSWSVVEQLVVVDGIREQIERGAIDLVALASHGRTGLGRLVAGSVALDVVRHVTVPLLTVRPDNLR